jgi:hypothetical protein
MLARRSHGDPWSSGFVTLGLAAREKCLFRVFRMLAVKDGYAVFSLSAQCRLARSQENFPGEVDLHCWWQSTLVTVHGNCALGMCVGW